MNELHEAIWSVSGREQGKTLTIVGGTHGNERTGVEVVLKLREMIESGVLKMEAGTCNLILGNPRAIALGQKRSSSDSPDLNRSYPTDLLESPPDGTYEDARARQIAPFLIQSDVAVDLHSTTNPSEPFLACLDTPRHREIVQWFTCDKVLTDPNFVTGGASVTTDEYTEAHGGIGICYETGEASDTSRVNQVIDDIRGLMAHLKITCDESRPTPLREREVFELVGQIIVTSNGFRFAEGWGKQSWEPFNEGDVIGYHGENPLVMSSTGRLVFPKPELYWTEGNRVGCLARKLNQ
ncbi:MAG: succinylglutamate desuccinylase/aspartoacylase family protein [Patescibacteria group bacterium]